MAESKLPLTFYHWPRSRSSGARVLLEELDADYQLEVVNIEANEQRKPEFLAINPMGKLPTITHGDAVVTEQAAVYMYLAELFPKAGLAPDPGDPLRGPYLRWMVFYGSCFEPGLVDFSMKRDPGPHGRSPYGDWKSVMDTLIAQLGKGPWLLGEKFSAADVLWGGALSFASQFGILPESPVIKAYIARFGARPAVARARKKDEELMAHQPPGK